MRALIDFETFGVLPLKGKDSVGAWRYAEHPETEIICMGYQLDGERKLWSPYSGEPFPEELIRAAEDGVEFEAHNAQFEVAIWYYCLAKRHGIPLPKRWRDTMAVCAYRALPLSLDNVSNVLDLEHKKNPRGSYLISRLCKPRKPTKNNPATRLWDFDLLEELEEYCLDDVSAEADLARCIGDLPVPEQRIWAFDQRINRRGVAVDREAVDAAIEIIRLITEKYTAELRRITNGDIETASQVKVITPWLQERGIDIPNLQAAVVEEVLDNWEDCSRYADPKTAATCRRVLEIRQTLGKSSLAKMHKLAITICDDGVVRGMLQYHAAGTGRWAGRGVQPQNLPRGSLSRYCDELELSAEDCMELLVDTIKLGGAEAVEQLEAIFGDPVEALSTAIRGMFVSKPGHRFYVADFSAIEARVVMWVAQQRDTLGAFRAYDRGEGPDIYCVMAQSLYGRPINKKDDPEERGLGKVTILGCGYQMGPPKLQHQAKKDYGLDITLETAEFLVGGYRSANYMVKNLWYGLEDAAISAVRNPGKRFSYSYISYETVSDEAGLWLTCILPNGRRLWYYNPKVSPSVTPWGADTWKLSYEGRDNKKGGAWGRVYTYGGMLTENVVQAISRDIMVEAMIRVEMAGYPVVLTVHDEVVADVPDGHGSLEEFEQLMTGPLAAWIGDCPISVEGWTGTRYRKD